MYLVNKLINAYQTNDPIEIAKELDIIILYENLGTIKGYYNSVFGNKFIHVNNKLPDYIKKFVIAHELGHALLHKGNNTPYLKYFSFINLNRLENEANLFAVNLLITDEDIEEYKNLEYTKEQISIIHGLPKELIELRFQNYIY